MKQITKSNERSWKKVLLWGGLIAGVTAIPVVAIAGPHMGPGRHMGLHAPENAQQVRAHLQKASDMAFCTEQGVTPCLVQVDEGQKRRIDTVLDGLAPKMFTHHGEAKDLHAEMRDQLTAERIDRGDIEEVRQDGLDLADRASRDLLGAIVDIAEVLTPEQRQKLGKGVERRHGRKHLH